MALEELTSADGPSFRQLFAIYAASIDPREQKPEAWIRAMVVAPEYRVWMVQREGRVLGFSIMAVAPEQRGHGFGAQLFRKTVAQALTPEGATLPVLLEVDSDREASSDRALRTRRLHFYRRLGCRAIAGLAYLMPLRGVGPAPQMHLMIYPEPTAPLALADLKRWLETIYQDVYHAGPDDPRIAQMLHPVPDPVTVEEPIS